MDKQRFHFHAGVKYFVFRDKTASAHLHMTRDQFVKDGAFNHFDLICQCDTVRSAIMVCDALNQIDSTQRKVDEDALKTFEPAPCLACEVHPCVCKTLRRLKLDPWTPISGPSDAMPSVMDDLEHLMCPVSPLSDFSVKIDRKITARELYGMIDTALAPMPVVIHMPCKGLDKGCVCDNCVPF